MAPRRLARYLDRRCGTARVGRGGSPVAGESAGTGFRADPACRLRGLHWGLVAATRGHVPKTAGYITLVFRMYGIYIVAFGLLAIAIAATAYRRGDRWAWWTLLVGNTIAFVSAMTYDVIVGAIGPFELSEYLGLAAIYGSLALTAPFPHGAERGLRIGPTGGSPGWE